MSLDAFKNLTTWKQVYDLVRIKALDYGLSQLKDTLSNDYIYMEEAIEHIWTGLVMGKNVLLYGPGGYAKTDLVKDIMRVLEIPLNKKVIHPGITVEHLFGVPDMEKLMKESKLEYAWHQTVFACPGVLALEEGLDAQGDIMATLKDIITEHGLRDKDLLYESLASSFIITTNKSPEEYGKDDSVKAFVDERFPYTYKVVWDSYVYEDYKLLFEKKYKNKFTNDLNILAELCEQEANRNNIISPRKAIYSADLVLQLGLNSLKTIGFNNIDINEYKERVKSKNSYNKLKIILDKTSMMLSDIHNIYTGNKIVVIFKKYKILNEIYKRLILLEFPDDLAEKFNLVHNNYKNAITNTLGSLNSNIKLNTDTDRNFIETFNNWIK